MKNSFAGKYGHGQNGIAWSSGHRVCMCFKIIILSTYKKHIKPHDNIISYRRREGKRERKRVVLIGWTPIFLCVWGDQCWTTGLHFAWASDERIIQLHCVSSAHLIMRVSKLNQPADWCVRRFTSAWMRSSVKCDWYGYTGAEYTKYSVRKITILAFVSTESGVGRWRIWWSRIQDYLFLGRCTYIVILKGSPFPEQLNN